MERPMDSMLSSIRSRKHETGSPLLLPEFRNVGWRLEPAVDDLVDQLLGQAGVTGGQGERHHHHAVLEALEVALPIEGLQRVAGVVLNAPRKVGKRNFLAYARSVNVLTKLREYWSSTSRS